MNEGRRLLQLMPAPPGWFAVDDLDDGTLLKSPVIAFGLVEVIEYDGAETTLGFHIPKERVRDRWSSVHPLIVGGGDDRYGYLFDASEARNFLGLQGPGESDSIWDPARAARASRRAREVSPPPTTGPSSTGR